MPPRCHGDIQHLCPTPTRSRRLGRIPSQRDVKAASKPLQVYHTHTQLANRARTHTSALRTSTLTLANNKMLQRCKRGLHLHKRHLFIPLSRIKLVSAVSLLYPPAPLGRACYANALYLLLPPLLINPKVKAVGAFIRHSFRGGEEGHLLTASTLSFRFSVIL